MGLLLSSVVEMLLHKDVGAKPELKDRNGLTVLLLACNVGHIIAAELLVAPTAAAEALDVCNAMGRTALMWPVETGLMSVVERFVAAGAKAEVKDNNWITALALACVKVCDILVLSGAKATAAETSAKISVQSVGCWVKATGHWIKTN